MGALEICLIVVGIAAIAISYFISEKAADEKMQKAVEKLVLSEETKQSLMKQTRASVEETLNGMSEEIAEKAEIQLEKLSNEKIMAVHEYSDTVLEEIGKNHQEVMFLYSMLDDKDKEVKNTVKEVQKAVKAVRHVSQTEAQAGFFNEQAECKNKENSEGNLEESVKKDGYRNRTLSENLAFNKSLDTVENGSYCNVTEDLQENLEKETELGKENPAKEFSRTSKKSRGRRNRKKTTEKREKAANDTVSEKFSEQLKNEKTQEEPVKNKERKNDTVIELCKQGKSNLEIAKELGLGTGEVKLMIDLYHASQESKGNGV